MGKARLLEREIIIVRLHIRYVFNSSNMECKVVKIIVKKIVLLHGFNLHICGRKKRTTNITPNELVYF